MKKIIIAVPHSHTWLWSGACVSALHRNPPVAAGYETEIIVVDNSPWSPAIRGITDTRLGQGITVYPNTKGNRFHASALDSIVQDFQFDLLMALETDVLALRPDWLQWFVDQLRPTDFAVGHWHHEQFINPSCTLYRGDVLRAMDVWCKANKDPEVSRWGERFQNVGPLDTNMPNWAEEEKRTMVDWISGPFAEKRGWPEGTVLKETPSGQMKGISWYEPGQQLHHWAVESGYTYTVCQTDTHFKQPGMPVQTLYGAYCDREINIFEMETVWPGYVDGLSNRPATAHLWGGTRALDIIKHEVTCQFVQANTPYWLEREARFWRDSVPADVQEKTLQLIRQYGWHYKGAGTPDVTDRDRAAVKMIQECYAKGGVNI